MYNILFGSLKNLQNKQIITFLLLHYLITYIWIN